MNGWPDRPDDPESIGLPPDFPPAPWRTWGTIALGVFDLAETAAVRHGLTAVSPRRLVVGTIRYLGGDLGSYDLLMVGSLARHRHRIGVHFHDVWVDSPRMQQATVALWGIPIGVADFSWSGGQVQIAADDNIAITLTVRPRTRKSAPVFLPIPCFGTHQGKHIYINVPLRGKARPAALQLLDWPDQLPTLSRDTTSMALEIPLFRMKVPQSRDLDAL